MFSSRPVPSLFFWQARKKLPEAEQVQERAVTIAENVYGPDHPQVLYFVLCLLFCVSFSVRVLVNAFVREFSAETSSNWTAYQLLRDTPLRPGGSTDERQKVADIPEFEPRRALLFSPRRTYFPC